MAALQASIPGARSAPAPLKKRAAGRSGQRRRGRDPAAAAPTLDAPRQSSKGTPVATSTGRPVSGVPETCQKTVLTQPRYAHDTKSRQRLSPARLCGDTRCRRALRTSDESMACKGSGVQASSAPPLHFECVVPDACPRPRQEPPAGAEAARQQGNVSERLLPLKAVAPVRIRSGLPTTTSTTRPLTWTNEGRRPSCVSDQVRLGSAVGGYLCLFVPALRCPGAGCPSAARAWFKSHSHSLIAAMRTVAW